MSKPKRAQSTPNKHSTSGDVIRSYYLYIDDIYQKQEKGTLTSLAAFAHNDHLIFNMLKTGTFTDKINAIKELISVT